MQNSNGTIGDRTRDLPICSEEPQPSASPRVPYPMCKVNVKVKQSRNRPGVAQRVPGGLGSQLPRHSACKGGEVVSLTHRPLLPQEFSWYSFLPIRPQGHGTVGRRYVTEKSSETIANQSRDRPTSSAAP
jgi:hypothetical protein